MTFHVFLMYDSGPFKANPNATILSKNSAIKIPVSTRSIRFIIVIFIDFGSDSGLSRMRVTEETIIKIKITASNLFDLTIF